MVKGQPNNKERIYKFRYKQTPAGELSAYIRFPEGWSRRDMRPAVVFFFGGGWQIRRVHQFDFQAEYFAKQGLVSVLIDYRVRSEPPFAPDECVKDGKSAIRWLRSNASKFGLDVNKVAVVGGSSGAHMAACLPTSDAIDEDSDDLNVSAVPNLLVLMNPILDLTDKTRTEKIGNKALAPLLSPNQHLFAEMPPSLLCYGIDDPDLAHGLTYFEKLQNLNGSVDFYIWPNATHAFFNRSPWRESTLRQMDIFLSQHGFMHPIVAELTRDKTGFFKVDVSNLESLKARASESELTPGVRMAMYKLVEDAKQRNEDE